MLQQTIDGLHQLNLRGMATALEEQFNGGDYGAMSFEERLALLVDREVLARQSRSLTRRLAIAKLKVAACIEDIDYRHPRGLDKGVMQDLATGRWIAAKRNVLLSAATGLGKTWLACALGNQACRDGYSTIYKRVPRLIEELTLARADGTYLKVLAALARTDLLILDDWALTPLSGTAQHSLLEVIDDRTATRSTIVTSQFPVAKWHDAIGDPSVADALLDRLLSSSTQISLKGKTMR